MVAYLSTEPEDDEVNQVKKTVDSTIENPPTVVTERKEEAVLSFAEQWERAGMEDALADPSNLRPSCEELSMSLFRF